ncbi:hypothetical protein F5X71_24885 [Nocardia brasiliensis]|uniref:Uncharacterized protein n=1 Tax=Nocardia brasiliensis TaxID=37326 RepID=A0A6G9XVX0_NOCBR|nr:hypothetical protein [Nocardia brasiliensis]QIS05121.1 hypothetical protein F5X71_24885 [Nocardia brasiliensis]
MIRSCKGDLLVATLRVPESYWSEHPDMVLRLKEVVGRLRGTGEKPHDVEQPRGADRSFTTDDMIWKRIGELRESGIL